MAKNSGSLNQLIVDKSDITFDIMEYLYLQKARLTIHAPRRFGKSFVASQIFDFGNRSLLGAKEYYFEKQKMGLKIFENELQYYDQPLCVARIILYPQYSVVSNVYKKVVQAARVFLRFRRQEKIQMRNGHWDQYTQDLIEACKAILEADNRLQQDSSLQTDDSCMNIMKRILSSRRTVLIFDEYDKTLAQVIQKQSYKDSQEYIKLSEKLKQLQEDQNKSQYIQQIKNAKQSIKDLQTGIQKQFESFILSLKEQELSIIVIGVLKLGHLEINSGNNSFLQLTLQSEKGYNQYGFTRSELRKTKFQQVSKYLLRARKNPLYLKVDKLFPEQVKKYPEAKDAQEIQVNEGNIFDLTFDLHDGYWGSINLQPQKDQTVLPASIPLAVLYELAQYSSKDKTRDISTTLWTGLGSANVPNYVMGKAKANFNSETFDIIDQIDKNGAIIVKDSILRQSSDVRAYDSQILSQEMTKSLFRADI